MRTLNEHLAVRMVGTPASYADFTTNLTWVDLTGYNRALFIVGNGELDGNMVFTVKQASASDGTGAKDLDTTLTGTFTNGTDEGRVGLIEVRASDLDEGFPYITLEINPGAADTAFAIAVLEGYTADPVANGTANGVAFNVGE